MVAKTASKNNPTKRKKGLGGKMYNSQKVNPLKIIDRDSGDEFVGASYEGGKIVTGSSGIPLRWKEI